MSAEVKPFIEKNEIDEINEGNSLISVLLDYFDVKGILELLFKLPLLNKIKVTQKFYSAVLLLIFLTFIFWDTGILKLENRSVVIVLSVFIIAIIGELLSANFQFITKMLVSEERTKSFLANIPSMSNDDIESGIKSSKFSVNNLNQFFEKIKDPNAFSPNVISIVIENQILAPANLNTLFNPEVLKNLNEKILTRILIRYGDVLSNENTVNCYEVFKNSNDIIKLLIASNKYSDLLLKKYPNDSRLNDYFDIYQKNKQHMDWPLKLTPLPLMRKIRNWSMGILFLFILPFFVIVSLSQRSTANYGDIWVYSITSMISIFIGTLLLTTFICVLTVMPIYKILRDFHYNRFEKNVLKQ